MFDRGALVRSAVTESPAVDGDLAVDVVAAPAIEPHNLTHRGALVLAGFRHWACVDMDHPLVEAEVAGSAGVLDPQCYQISTWPFEGVGRLRSFCAHAIVEIPEIA
jgi:hypothetical protein